MPRKFVISALVIMAALTAALGSPLAAWAEDDVSPPCSTAAGSGR
jgi:hypothetical protein